MMIDPKVWHEQRDFNATLRPDAEYTQSETARVKLTKDFALHMISEITEMLDACGTWAMHRRKVPLLTNEENIRRQLIDQFKYWMSICQLWGFTPEQMEATFWRKSATVRARFSEEFMITLDRRAVILDLDNVLCDYSAGFADWAIRTPHQMRDSATGARVSRGEFMRRMEAMRDDRKFFSAENAGIDLGDWMQFQHKFRVSGGFGDLPPMPGLAEFSHWLLKEGYCVIGLTSRSIDQYPNIIDDTLSWLSKHGVIMDCVWWGPHKGEKLTESFPRMDLIDFVVDDDPRYLRQYTAMGMKRIYWMRTGWEVIPGFDDPNIIPVDSLTDIIRLEAAR